MIKDYKDNINILNIDIDFDNVSNDEINPIERYIQINTKKRPNNKNSKYALFSDNKFVSEFLNNILNISPVLSNNEIIFKIRTSSLETLRFLPEEIQCNKIMILLIPNNNYFLDGNFWQSVLVN